MVSIRYLNVEDVRIPVVMNHPPLNLTRLALNHSKRIRSAPFFCETEELYIYIMKISILVSLQLYKNYFYAFFRFGVIYNIIYSFLNIFCYFVVLLALYELDSNGSIWSVYKRCTQVHGRALIHKLVSPANKCFNYFK